MKKINNITIVLSSLLAISTFSFGQNNVEVEKITKYLESTIDYKDWLMVSSTAQNIVAVDILESRLSFNVGQKSSSILQEQYFIKSDNKLTPYKTLNDMFSSSEFIESIKIKKFKLNTDEDGLAFEGLLWSIDKERGLGFFKEDNVWYFVRSEFFDNKEVFVVSTDENGQINSVIYEEKLQKEMPDLPVESYKLALTKAAAAAASAPPQNTASKIKTVSEKDSTYMNTYLLDDLNYVFEISPESLNSVNAISTISIYKCALKITENAFVNRTPFLIVANNETYIKQSEGEKVLNMPIFLESLEEKYKLKTEADAKLFFNLLNDLELFEFNRKDDELNTYYEKDKKWIFVRKKSFGKMKGYVLTVDEKHKVSHIEYTDVANE